MFKSVDERFEEMGFIKIYENGYGVRYERENTKYGYIHVIEIRHKSDGDHIVQTYDKELMDPKMIGNTCVGLSYNELKLVLKKMKEMGYHKGK